MPGCLAGWLAGLLAGWLVLPLRSVIQDLPRGLADCGAPDQCRKNAIKTIVFSTHRAQEHSKTNGFANFGFGPQIPDPRALKYTIKPQLF